MFRDLTAAVQSAGQSSAPVFVHDPPSCVRPQLPDYELAVRHQNERRHRQKTSALHHLRGHSVDSMPHDPD